MPALIGHEGDAAAYFAAFGRMLGNGFAFPARSRRPPRDPANALLSLSYTLLTAEATSAVPELGLTLRLACCTRRKTDAPRWA